METKTTNSNNWYKDAIIYQAHVRSFKDSNGDGIGDFKGLIEKLDYLKGLGVNALWLLPFYKSPLKDGGYDISDFTKINEDYGNLKDFKLFVNEAHRRDIKVITELVLNHTSNEHIWFEKSRRAKPGSVNRDFYVWSDTTEKYSDARIIFQDFELSNWTWDPVAKAYYWHRFYSHQPDLNFDNPSVHKALFKVLDFWFKIGVDGLRLDAIPYLYERENTNCENLEETHAFLKKLRAYVDENHEGKMLLAEANQWPEDASKYFGDGDECQMAFHFPLMPRLYMSMKMEDRFPLIDILEQTPDIPDNCQWAIFLRNHDELTLEMVTDEERDYMYKSFAKNPKQRINLGIRRRLSPLLDNDRKSIELMNVLLFSMPGTPIVYYGDEIGMGDNYYLGDRDGVRTPMQWSSDKNAGFSSADPQQLFLPVVFNYDYHYESFNVDNQERNPTSMLWWMRSIIGKRKMYKAFSRGDIEFIETNNSKVLAFTRSYESETILVIINLSKHSQQVELELKDYNGHIPVEVFSNNEFSPITDAPYAFPIQSKNYFWFELRKVTEEELNEPLSLDFELKLTSKEWNQLNPKAVIMLTSLLKEYIQKCRWFRGKSKRVKNIEIIESVPIRDKVLNSYVLITEAEYVQGKNENYVIPLSIVSGDEAMNVKYKYPEAVISDVEIDEREVLLYDGSYNQHLRDEFIRVMANRAKLKNSHAELAGIPGSSLKQLIRNADFPISSKVINAEQSNTSLLYDNRFFFKMYRSPEEGYNPELEIIKALTEQTSFRNFPTYAGELELRKNKQDKMTLGILVDYVSNAGNAWEFVKSSIETYFEKLLANRNILEKSVSDKSDPLQQFDEATKEELFPSFLMEMIELLGKRTAEMHLALSSIKGKEFVEEPFSLLYQKSLYQSFRTFIKRTLSDIKKQRRFLDDKQKELVDYILENENILLNNIKNILEKEKIHSSKIRVHGDYHLGQVLFTGKDFIIIDFEGEPTRSLTARKLKYCPFKDVAGMLRSFHYAIYMAHLNFSNQMPEDAKLLQPWLNVWYKHVSEAFTNSYNQTAGNASFMPGDKNQQENLLSLFTIEKAIYEADYEANNRPDWLHIPLNGLYMILSHMND